MRKPTASFLTTLSLAALGLACAGSAEERTTVAVAPALGAADGADAADHGCQVVLRQAYRQPTSDGLATDCSSGTCNWVWTGSVEVAKDVVDRYAGVHVLYHLTADPDWWDVAATPAASAAPGYAGFEVKMSDHLIGPTSTDAATATIELVPYLLGTDGSRLFDHNRYADETTNHILRSTDLFLANDGGACAPVVGSVSFTTDGSMSTFGTIRQGGYLRVAYAIDRLTECRGTHNGFPAWDIVASARFQPGGQLVTGSVRALENDKGIPNNSAHDLPLEVKVPDDATAVELWFQNYTGAGSTCEAWDSNGGANYQFAVRPAATPTRCNGVETWTREAGGQPTCVDYDVSDNRDAEGCELFLDGIGHGYEGHYGIPYEWLEAYVRTAAEAEAVGLFTRYTDDRGIEYTRTSLGTNIGPGLWKTGFTYHTTAVWGTPGYQYSVKDMAFFADVRGPSGDIVRVWQSHSGANYRWDDAFSLPTTNESIPYGNTQWANDASEVFATKRACR